MKNHIISYLLLIMIFTACQKESPEVYPTLVEQNTMEKSLQKQLNQNAQVSLRVSTEPSNSCQLPECNIIIDQQYGVLLSKANELCQPVSNCVECCMNNWVAYVVLYVEPTSPQCNELDYNSSLLESF